MIDLHSDGVMNLGTISDVIGLTGRQPGAAVCRILQGRDVRSVRALVPDSRGLEQNFHDVAHGPPSYGVAAERPGCDVRGGQETVP